MIKVLMKAFEHVCEVAAPTNWILLSIVMDTPSGIKNGFQLCDGSDSKGEVEDASISPTLSHAEVPELQNISRIAESIKTQDFLTSIYEGVSGCFPDLSFVMSCASVNSDMQIPVLVINQCHLI